MALFDLALDSKLRGCDLVALKISDLMSGSGVQSRVMILQRKTGRPVQFEVTEQTRRSIAGWIEKMGLAHDDWLSRGCKHHQQFHRRSSLNCVCARRGGSPRASRLRWSGSVRQQRLDERPTASAIRQTVLKIRRFDEK
jgi:integrase